MVAEIAREMDGAGVEPDAKEQALLDVACQLVDRLAALDAVIARDGEMQSSPSGLARVHPAVAEHRQLAATLPKVLAGIVVGESVGVRNPAKVQAAQVRWANRDRRREVQARRVVDG